jgi:RNA polymerase sigma-B factor
MSAVDTSMPVRRLAPGHPLGCPARRTSGAALERRLFRRYRATGDPAVRGALVERFLPLARHVALRHNRSSEPLEDLYQVACVALVLAIDRYDPERDTAFSSFAVPTIAGEIKRHLRDRTWAVHVPRSLRELAIAVRRAQQEIAGDLGRPATIGELAAATSASPPAVRDALHALEARVPGSLDGRASPDDLAGATLGDRLGIEEQGYRRVEHRAHLAKLLAALPGRQRAVLRLRFADDLTQREIGERIGVSQMQAYRLLRDALERLHALEHGGPPSPATAVMRPCGVSWPIRRGE